MTLTESSVLATPSLAEERAPGSSGAFPIVGIGASAGGLEAFRQLLGALPIDTGMAFVLVQHLDPYHESILAELLSEATLIEVSEVKGDMRVEPNRVYVIPPSKGLILVDGRLELVPRSPVGSAHMPIDSFLRTLADVQGSQAIGVILSGMGSDGTLGLQAIKGAGGIVFAQDPASAKNDAMPLSAIATGGVDFILTPSEIARELTRLGRHPYVTLGERTPRASAPAPSGVEERKDDEALARILELLRQSTGTDFGAYKKTTLRRRIARRMAVRRIEALPEYARELETDVAEATALYEDCLISVTSFFRDPEVFQALSERVLPSLLKDRASPAPVRIWVPGCATGEEVYSIAMCLLERAAELLCNRSLQIFATDLSESALTQARAGAYPLNIARDVSAERLQRFFTKIGERYQISKAIREMCVFARHDLTRDPPYSRMDLISCRNLLIYLEPSLQEVVFATLHYALRPEGFLVIAPAETTGASSTLFSTIDDKHRIYSPILTSGTPRLLSVMRGARPSSSGREQVAQKTGVSEIPREVDRMLLARFGPAGVVVDEGLRILEFRGDTDPFLDHGHGKASLNLEHLLRKGLLMELRQAIEKARGTDATVRREGLQVRYRQHLQSVSVEVIPIKGRAAAERCLLILFETEAEPSLSGQARYTPPVDLADTKDREIERLGRSLAQITEYMHTLVREHESALEELQSTNEEALSSNEELQSLNEELQTAKEEIQSANEELATLNQELQDRNVQLGRSNDEIQRGLDSANALVETVPQPIVILDSELRVEQANMAFYDAFQASAEQTRGRRLQELGHGQWNHAGLLAALQELLSNGTAVEDLEVESEFPALGLRTMSVNARRLHSDRGPRAARLLLAIEDRTESKRAARGREALLELEHTAREKAEAADHLKDQFVATVSHELRGPLTIISGWMNILVAAGKNPDPAVLTRALAAIGRGVAAQGRLISDLLDHSRIVTGKVELSRAPIDLLAIAEAALMGVRAAAEAKDIHLELSGDHATSVVLGDSDRMQQVLWNLFLNAVKFTPRGGSVRIAIGRVNNQVQMTVTDTGRGIPEQFLPHVFERFRQAESSTNRNQPGLGLGLTLVRELVELHGGTVGAASAGKDQGATFTVVLPVPAVLLPAPESDWPQPDSEPPPPSVRTEAQLVIPSHLLEGVVVLVVDDEVDAREALVGLLERYGARVFSATSTVEAMAALQAGLPDVLISDLGMPGEDGYELMRRLRRLPADAGGQLPSLALSAYATEEHRKKVMSSGFQGYLEKPVAPAELVTEVARLAALEPRFSPPLTEKVVEAFGGAS
jgi:two-component system, chemotaxis family, CheB/CheR fusion protein